MNVPRQLLLAIAAALFLAATPTLAQDTPAIAEIRDAYAACTAHLEAQPDNWFGWRRVYDGGYADIFEFWDQGADGYGPSVLKRTWLIDAIASVAAQTYPNIEIIVVNAWAGSCQ